MHIHIRRVIHHSALCAVIALAGRPCLGDGATITANPSNYRDALAALAAGDTLVLETGTYARGLPISNKNGTAANPIIIRGPDDQSAVFTADDCCNTVQLDSVSHVVIRGLTLNGAGTNGAFGVDSRGPCHHVTIENLRIVNYGADQQNVGISTKGPAWDWIIRGNTIIRAGTGLYLGSSDGSAPFVNGLIEHNLVVDTIGYNMQIKHQNPRPTGIGLPTGQSRTIIRHNVFSKQDGTVGSDGPRPNVLVGHFPLTGTGANDRYEIYGNFFYQNPVEALFQGEGNIALHDNIFVNTSGSGINITSHNDRPRTVTVYHNTVVAGTSGVRISNADPAYLQRIIANAVFAESAITGPNQQGNVTGSFASASTFLVAPTAPIGTLDLFPRPGQLSGGTTDLAAFSEFVDGTRDFNGNARQGGFRGAYEGEGANPGWRLALAIKPSTGGVPAPAVSLVADPLTVSLQGSSTLAWAVSNADSCTASGGWSGAKGLNGSETVGPLASPTTFTLTCSGAGGTGSRSVTVATVGSIPAPTVSISALPTSVLVGGVSTLAWQSTNATTCVASGGWTGEKGSSGSETVGPIDRTTTYSLACTGEGGSASADSLVSVAVAPSLTFQVDRTSLSAGESATLTWSTAGATSCSASDGWSGNKATSGSQSTGPLYSTSTFTLTCSGTGGDATRQVGIAVMAADPPAASGADESGGSGRLTPLALLALLLLTSRKRFLVGA